jgi:hypothetical protein
VNVPPGGFNRRLVLAAMLTAASAACVLVVLYTLAGHQESSFPRGSPRDRDLVRLVGVGAATSLALLWACWGRSAWQRVAATFLAILAALGLALLVRGAVPTWPVGDGAMAELYTIHAARGAQLLGAYSQFRWHHPGPLFFYFLTPLYVLGGRSGAALDAGALAINLASLSTIVWVLLRRKGPSLLVAEALLGFLLLYVVRVPELLTSAWNPHPPVLAFAALLALSATALAGELGLLPWTALFASFITQTHIGYAPVSVALLLLTFGTAAVANRRHADRWRLTVRYALISAGILEIAWILPVAEQLTGSPGNMTLVWRFFFSGGPGQPTWLALRVWSGGLAAAVSPNLSLPIGSVVAMPGAWPIIAGTTSVLALCPIAVWARRRRYEFCAALAVVCLVASSAGLWSVLHVQGTIGDYHAFWLSIVGLFNVALIVGVLLSIAVKSLGDGVGGLRLLPLTGALLVGVTAGIGCWNLSAEKRRSRMEWDNVTVRDLTEQILHNLGTRSHPQPLIRFDAGMWAVGPGLVLQMAKASIPLTVDSDATWMFGQRFLTTGSEDLLLTVCGPSLHRELEKRANNVTIAHQESASVFVDSVSLVDAPQYRLTTTQR